MGTKRKRKGKRLFLYSACLLTLFLLTAGCAGGLKSYKRQKDGNKHIEQAEKLFAQSDYEGAMKEDMSALDLLSGGTSGNKALFHMGLIWSHPDNPERDYYKALGYFQQVANDFPVNALTREARVFEGAMKEVLLLQGRIKEGEEKVTTLNKQLNEGEEKVNNLTKQLNNLKETQTRIEEKNKGLEDSIKALKRQLDALKEIDLGAEEKRREDIPLKTNR
jgi:hypothetical protein